ncbi:MAG: hypothetical protein U0736_12070 [Gemmataceae bacterium]
MKDAIRLERNTLRAIARGADTGRAVLLAVAGLDAGVDLHIRDNVLESNDSAITLGDGEGDVDGLTLTGNTLVRSTAGAARLFVAVHAGSWTQAVRNVVILDTRLRGGAELAAAGAGQRRRSRHRRTAPRPHRPCRDGDRDRPAAAATIFRGPADATGEVRDIPVTKTRCHRQPTADPRQAAVDPCGPFTVTGDAQRPHSERTPSSHARGRRSSYGYRVVRYLLTSAGRP